jgi:glyoxalase family protein
MHKVLIVRNAPFMSSLAVILTMPIGNSLSAQSFRRINLGRFSGRQITGTQNRRQQAPANRDTGQRTVTVKQCPSDTMMVTEKQNMPTPIPGLHHVTAIASDPQRNLDFYTSILGLRFVKRTVNFDDPGTYHFYFGDDAGSPGTILTFFPWPGATRGASGAGEVTQTAFSIPVESLGYWEDRLRAAGLSVERTQRFQEQLLSFSDPDGMRIELVGHAEPETAKAPRFASVPAEYAIRGFFGVTLFERQAAPTAVILNQMGFHQAYQEGSRLRFLPEGNALGRHIDLVIDPDARRGRMGAGSVHHIAFRASDDAAQLEWRKEIGKHLDVTTVQDRTYFHSIYFREPGGVLFEMATDPPGFMLDEPIESLGEQLRIPEWLEPQRQELERRLPAITLQKSTVTA